MGNHAVVWDSQQFQAACLRFREAPADLTESDIAQLDIFNPALAREAVQARHKALQPATSTTRLSKRSMDAIAEAVVIFFKGQLAPILTRLDAIEHREKDREKGVPNVRWRGTFKEGDTFCSGELATHRGALWLCKRDGTSQKPGRPAEGEAPDWVLIVKSGGVPQ